MNKHTVLVLDLGGKYKELLAKRVRQCGVYSRIVSGSVPVERIREFAPAGIIITAGEEAAECDPELFSLGIPVLGIDKGANAMVLALGGEVVSCERPEEPKVSMRCSPYSPLFEGLDILQTAYFVNDTRISRMPEGFDFITVTDDLPMAGVADEKRKLYGLQFHPEKMETPGGAAMIKNFLLNICCAEKEHTLDNVGKQLMEMVRNKAAGRKVLLAVSGGADSAVCAALMVKAIPDKFSCVFVDNGFMPENEGENAAEALKELEIELTCIDAKDRFFAAVEGVYDADEKRRIIERELIKVLEEHGADIGAEVLALGTVYNDIEDDLQLREIDTAFADVMEPLNWLFKDEAHAVGARIGMSGELLYRQSVPCTGLASRVVGEVTREKIETVRAADAIFSEEMENSIVMADMFFSILTDKSALGGTGSEKVIILRAVTKTDLMGSEYAQITQGILSRISARIHREIGGISRVLFDITADEYAPVEW
ncbi:MAG: hypothetical protein E7430_05420 [Ruminococcaceae bacterium]|nr:hypothetical protein [Oscillospiraceae bacterium]